MSAIIEEGPHTPISVSRLVSLIVVPVIALALLAALALRQDVHRGQPAPVRAAFVTDSATHATPGGRGDELFTLYILNSADAAEELADLGGGDWYAHVATPSEEAELARALDEANWIRHESGLSLIRVVDLRLSPVASTSAHGTPRREEQ